MSEEPNSLIDAMAKELAGRHGFEGAIIYRDSVEGPEPVIKMVTNEGLREHQLAKLLGAVQQGAYDPGQMSISALIVALRDHPSFRGAIVQELGYDAKDVVGHTRLQWDISPALTHKLAGEMLRFAANELDPSLQFHLPLAVLTSGIGQYPLVETIKGMALPIFDSLEDADLFIGRGPLPFGAVELSTLDSVRKAVKGLRKVHPNFDILYNPLDPNRVNAVAFSIKTFLSARFLSADEKPPAA